MSTRKGRILWMVLMIFLSVTITSCGKAIKINQKTSHYQFKGAARGDLQLQLDQFVAKAKAENRCPYARWEVKWMIDDKEVTKSYCKATKMRITPRMYFTNPKWGKPGHASLELVSDWDAYTDAVWRHQEKHRQTVAKTVKEIDRAIKNMTPRADCKELFIGVNEIAEAIVRENERIDREFDRISNYGRNEEAYLPYRDDKES